MLDEHTADPPAHLGLAHLSDESQIKAQLSGGLVEGDELFVVPGDRLPEGIIRFVPVFDGVVVVDEIGHDRFGVAHHAWDE